MTTYDVMALKRLKSSIKVITVSYRDLGPAILRQKIDCFINTASQCMDPNYGRLQAVA